MSQQPAPPKGFGMDTYFIAAFIIYLLLGYYLMNGNLSDGIENMCKTDPDEKSTSFLYDIFSYITCGLVTTGNRFTSVLAIRGLSIMLFLFGVYIGLMMIYFVRYANKPKSPDLYDLSNNTISFGSLFSFAITLFAMVVASIVLFLLILGFLHLFSYWTTVTSSIMFVLNVINAIVILALIYFYFLKQIQWGTRPRTFFELIKHVIFYVPCLFISLVESVTGIYNNTSHTVAVLLGVEAIVITAYFVIPLIMDYINNHIGTLLLEGPVYLTSKRSVGAFEDIHARTKKREAKSDQSWLAPLEGKSKDPAATDHMNLVPDNPTHTDSEYTKWQCADGVQDPTSREKCGKNSTGPEECLSIGCCWDKISDQKGPSCFKPKTFDGQTEVATLSMQPEGKKGDTYSIKMSMEGKPTPSTVMPRDFTYHYGLMFSYYINPQPPSTNASYTKYTNIISYNECPSVEYRGKDNSLRIRMKQGKGTPVVIYETKNVKLQKWNQVFVRYDGGTLDIFFDDELVSSTPSVLPYMTHGDVVIGEKNGINGGIKNVRYFDGDLDRTEISLLRYAS